MKIGVLSFHREINKGAVVQSFCLQKILQEKFPEASVEIIDYRPPEMEGNSTLTTLKLTAGQALFGATPNFYFQSKGKTHAVRDFLDQFCAISSESCSNGDQEQVVDFLNRQNYDAIFVGSDIVWSLQDQKGFPFPPNMYMLPEIDGPAKVGFAASMDSTDPILLEDDDLTQQVRNYISSFDFISVRDRYSRQRLNKIGIPDSDIRYMPDPTLLTNITDFVSVPDVSWGSHVAGVEIANPSVKENITMDLQAAGYKVVNLLGPSVGGQQSPPASLTVQERIGLYQTLDILVTNRFHGSIFALKTSDIPVVYIEQVDRYPDKRSKVRDLYLRLGMETQILRYKGEECLTDGWVSKYMEQWHGIQASIDDSLDSLHNQGLQHLRTIESIVKEKKLEGNQ